MLAGLLPLGCLRLPLGLDRFDANTKLVDRFHHGSARDAKKQRRDLPHDRFQRKAGCHASLAASLELHLYGGHTLRAERLFLGCGLVHPVGLGQHPVEIILRVVAGSVGGGMLERAAEGTGLPILQRMQK